MLYTIISEYDVFGCLSGTDREYRYMDGALVECVRQGEDLVVDRLITTDQRMYLNPGHAPGSVWRSQ